MFSSIATTGCINNASPIFAEIRLTIYTIVKVESAFHPSEVGEMSSSIINAAKGVVVVRIIRDPPGELLRQEFECTQPGLVYAAE